jgi:hypothetical protein
MSASGTTGPLNLNAPLIVTPPEEAAGAAYYAMLPMLESFGVVIKEAPMDLATRVLTNVAAVPAASQMVKANPDGIYVKGPGITPVGEQTLSAIIALETRKLLVFTGESGISNEQVAALRAQHRPQDSSASMQAFAKAVEALLKPIGSPNADWRDRLAANLSRGVSDNLAACSLVKPPAFGSHTPLSVAALPAQEGDNRLTAFAKGGAVSLTFTPETGAEIVIDAKVKTVPVGTPLRLFAVNKASVTTWVNAALASAPADAQLVHGTKQTVLKNIDAKLIQWMEEAIAAAGRSASIAPIAQHKSDPKKFGGLLVDDLFARLSTRQQNEPMLVLSPNPSYAQYVKDVWDGIKQAGGFKIPKNSDITRAASTGDHYKATDYIAPAAGTLRLKDESGATILEKALQAGDAAMFTALDKERVAYTVKQSLDNAVNTGKLNVIIGFDESDPYYKIAIDELHRIKGEAAYKTLTISITSAAAATVQFFTAGVANTTLLLNNIYGDFATDIELFGKGTNYSTGRIQDGRGVVELGSGGTAPDLLPKWKATGLLEFNPMSFVEAVGIALGYAAERLSGEDKTRTQAVSKALEEGMYATLHKGLVLPFIKGNFKKADNVEYTKVSTHTFLESVQLEAMRALKTTLGISDATITKLEATLARHIKADSAIYAIAADEALNARWLAANSEWNSAREQAGEIDPLKPNYGLNLPTELADITPQSLLKLQESRANAA